MRVSDRQSQREGMGPHARGSQRWPWIRAGIGTVGQSRGPENIQTYQDPFSGSWKRIGKANSPYLVPTSCPSTANLTTLRV